MFTAKIELLYGIDYNRYICGGLGDIKLHRVNGCRDIFTTEVEMLKRLSELKGIKEFDDFELFTTIVNPKPYKI